VCFNLKTDARFVGGINTGTTSYRLLNRSRRQMVEGNVNPNASLLRIRKRCDSLPARSLEKTDQRGRRKNFRHSGIGELNDVVRLDDEMLLARQSDAWSLLHAVIPNRQPRRPIGRRPQFRLNPKTAALRPKRKPIRS
jgi:hypothetical protein